MIIIRACVSNQMSKRRKNIFASQEFTIIHSAHTIHSAPLEAEWIVNPWLAKMRKRDTQKYFKLIIILDSLTRVNFSGGRMHFYQKNLRVHTFYTHHANSRNEEILIRNQLILL